MSGLDGDGKITVGAGVVALVVGIAGLSNPASRRWSGVGGLAGNVGAVVALIDVVNVQSPLGAAAAAGGLVRASSGVGLWLCLIGSCRRLADAAPLGLRGGYLTEELRRGARASRPQSEGRCFDERPCPVVGSPRLARRPLLAQGAPR